MFNVNTKGGARDETMKMPTVMQFVLKLTGTPVLTQLGTNTKNYRYLVPIYSRVKLVQLK